jgi:hypothetical protein
MTERPKPPTDPTIDPPVVSLATLVRDAEKYSGQWIVCTGLLANHFYQPTSYGYELTIYMENITRPPLLTFVSNKDLWVQLSLLGLKPGSRNPVRMTIWVEGPDRYKRTTLLNVVRVDFLSPQGTVLKTVVDESGK